MSKLQKFEFVEEEIECMNSPIETNEESTDLGRKEDRDRRFTPTPEIISKPCQESLHKQNSKSINFG